jgi:hypothetical protein
MLIKWGVKCSGDIFVLMGILLDLIGS